MLRVKLSRTSRRRKHGQSRLESALCERLHVLADDIWSVPHIPSSMFSGSETFLDGSNLNGDDSAKRQAHQRSNDVSETTATDTTEKKKDSLDKSSHRKKKKNEKKRRKKAHHCLAGSENCWSVGACERCKTTRRVV